MTENQLRLFRFGALDAEKPGAFFGPANNRKALDVSELCQDYNESFFESDGVTRLHTQLIAGASQCPVLNLTHMRFGSVVCRPSKIVAVGLNYRAHAVETGARVPTDPMLFMKASSALSGVNDRLLLPRESTHTDYEVELALVIGKRASYIDEENALNHVAGYTICNDYSERDWQKNRHGQFVKGKSADGFAPLGPQLVLAQDLNPADLRLWLSVNGEMRQDSRTSDMVFSCAQLVSRISQYMTLLPGDVICTGTPSGVGLGMKPPEYLRPGDIVRYGIEQVGEACQEICE